jgi:hypothetical protein
LLIRLESGSASTGIVRSQVHPTKVSTGINGHPVEIAQKGVAQMCQHVHFVAALFAQGFHALTKARKLADKVEHGWS